MDFDIKKYIEEIVEGKINKTVDELRQQVSDILSIQKSQGDSPSKLLTYADISAEFKISLKSLKKYKKMGLLVPLCKGGKYLLFDRKDVIHVLQTRPRIKPKFLD